MAAPTITIHSVSRYRISNKVGFDESIVYFFSADQALTDFVARVGGVSHDTGTEIARAPMLLPSTSLYPSANLYPSEYSLPKEEQQRFEVLASQLSGDGIYRINVYGKNAAGEWTPYAS